MPRPAAKVHLSAHLRTPLLLSEEQIDLDNKPRGYDAGDLCDFVPLGDDPVMWRKHNRGD